MDITLQKLIFKIQDALRTHTHPELGEHVHDYALSLHTHEAPRYSFMFAEQLVVVAGGANTISVNASQMHNYFVYQTGAADADERNGGAFLQTGVTYTFKLLCINSTNYGSVDVYVGATNIGTIDLYAGSTTYNNIETIGSVTVSTSGYYKVRLLINGKNASSSGYTAGYTMFWFEPSAY